MRSPARGPSMGRTAMSEQDIPANEASKPSGKRFTKKKVWLFVAVVLATAVALLFYILNERDAPDFNELLTRAKLARLPASIMNLQVEIRPAIDDGRPVPNEHWLFARFEAEPDDIGRFVNESACIDKRRFRPLSSSTNSSENPSWWSIDRSSSGWIYTIWGQHGTGTGNLVVDDESNVVLMFIWFEADPPYSTEDLKEDLEDFVEDLYRKL
jgi:hypothetical protein